MTTPNNIIAKRGGAFYIRFIEAYLIGATEADKRQISCIDELIVVDMKIFGIGKSFDRFQLELVSDDFTSNAVDSYSEIQS
jgi:hypothetical protein